MDAIRLETLTPSALKETAQILAVLKKRGVEIRLPSAKSAHEWPEVYTNSVTGKIYQPHSEAEISAVNSDSPRYVLFKGGEGAGKSVAGINKTLARLKRGCNGIMASPDLPHFKKSLWEEFRRWCPPGAVVPSQRYRLSGEWQPSDAFKLNFINGAFLLCGGMENPQSWEGPNVNFFHLDEARRAPTPQALKVLDGRIRIPGPNGESPQGWLTTTPAKNWLYEYFGPVVDNDERLSFKNDALVVTLLTEDNERAGNLEQGFTSKRRQSLTETEARVLLEAAWEDIDDVARFLPSMTLWDNCKAELPPLDKHTPIIIALDAAKGRLHSPSDCFGMLAVSRNPNERDNAAFRFTYKWQARSGNKIDYDGTDETPGPGKTLERLAKMYNIIQVCYDPTELHYFAGIYAAKLGLWFEEIPQAMGSAKRPGRGMYDGQLLDLITQRRVAHDGDVDLREHISNANKKTDPEDRRVRLVKRSDGQKIDLAVCASMGAGECLRLAI